MYIVQKINNVHNFTRSYRSPYIFIVSTELWLESKSKLYGPDYNSGRIKIAVSRGNQNLRLNKQDLSCKQLESGVLMGVGNNILKYCVTKESDGWHQEMHNFTVIWTPGVLYVRYL